MNDTDLRGRLLSDLGITQNTDRWTTPELLLWHQRKVLNREGLGLDDFNPDLLTPAYLDARYLTVLNVKNYGAAGNGITNDLVAIQAAIDDAPPTGAVIWLPPGDYIVMGTFNSGGAKVGIVIWKDNITIDGPGRIVQNAANAPNQRTIIVTGKRKIVAATDPLSQTVRYTNTTVYNMNPAADLAMSVSLVTPADAANFVVGDDIYIRSGQLFPGAVNPTPDAEMNVVESVNAGTGVIGLRFPLTKAFVQEYYLADGSTDGTDHALGSAPLGVSKVTDRTVHNTKIFVDFETTTDADYGVYIDQAVGVQVEGNRVKCFGFGIAGGLNFRDFKFSRISATRKIGGSTAANWFAPSTGCSDGHIKDNTLVGVEPRKMHAHEGIANLHVDGNIIKTGSGLGGGSLATFSAKARAYRHRYTNNTLIGSFTDVGATILGVNGAGKGNEFKDNKIVSLPGGNTVDLATAGAEWSIENNTFPTGATFRDLAGAGVARWKYNRNCSLDT